jgi:arylsulfatase A-like enzyme/Flp pilus assembly protein TadD
LKRRAGFGSGLRLLAAALPAAALLAAALLAGCGKPALNVLLITMDTTRADHLGCYGYAAIETPSIDRLAAEGTLYERCYTAAPITLPSHLSILTGTFPVYHGVHENNGFYVAGELTTLAEVLHAAGYATAAFVGAFPLDSQTGLDQGFDLYDDNYESSLEQGRHPLLRGFIDERPAAEVVRPALEWIDGRDGPFFLWTHFFDPHQPQIPPSPYSERYADTPYDGEIASVDEAIGRLLSRLDERGLLDHTLVVLAADHGEGLGDHGELTHALLLYAPTVRVPLIVRDPRDPTARRVDVPVATVDIMPTILERLGIAIPAAVQGQALPAGGGDPEPRRQLLTETLYGALLHGWSPLERLTVDDWVLIDGPRPRLYRLSDDPGELHDLAADDPERLDAMRVLLRRRKRELAAGGVGAAVESVSPEKQARLAALGYLSSGAGPVDASALEIAEDLPDPHDAIAVFRELNEGKNLTEHGRPALAAAVLEHAVQTDPTNPYLVHYLAQAYQQLGDAESARRVVDHLLTIAPEHVGGHLLSAELLAAAGDEDGALAAIERAVELDPKNQSTRLFLAHRLEDAGRDAEADNTYRALLTLAPGHTLARNGYATLLYRQGRVDEAVGSLEEVLRTQPYYPPAHLNLAVILHDQGRAEDSEQRVRRALELRPTYGPAYELHALNLEALGDQAGAREAWELARRFAYDAESRQRAEQRLDGSDHQSAPSPACSSARRTRSQASSTWSASSGN